MHKKELKSFNEFWNIYVLAHQNKTNQIFHFIATLASLILGVFFIIFQKLLLLILIPIISYAIAWIGHLKHEKNTPLTWTHPLYSLIADYKMFVLICIGRMKQEISKAQDEALAANN